MWKVFVIYIWLIDFILGDLKSSHNRQNGKHNTVSSANQDMGGGQGGSIYHTSNLRNGHVACVCR